MMSVRFAGLARFPAPVFFASYFRLWAGTGGAACRAREVKQGPCQQGRQAFFPGIAASLRREQTRRAWFFEKVKRRVGQKIPVPNAGRTRWNGFCPVPPRMRPAHAGAAHGKNEGSRHENSIS
jgi:hypothetical protein